MISLADAGAIRRLAVGWLWIARGGHWGRLPSAATMIPVSLVVVVVGGWTAIYLADLVLKVRASGLRSQPAQCRAGARGTVLPKAFPLPLAKFPPGAGTPSAVVSTCTLRGAPVLRRK